MLSGRRPKKHQRSHLVDQIVPIPVTATCKKSRRAPRTSPKFSNTPISASPTQYNKTSLPLQSSQDELLLPNIPTPCLSAAALAAQQAMKQLEEHIDHRSDQFQKDIMQQNEADIPTKCHSCAKDTAKGNQQRGRRMTKCDGGLNIVGRVAVSNKKQH